MQSARDMFMHLQLLWVMQTRCRSSYDERRYVPLTTVSHCRRSSWAHYFLDMQTLPSDSDVVAVP
jgi:hypothetical protein